MANATLSTHGGVDALENAQRKTLAGGTSAERKDMEKALRQRKRRRDRNFVRAKHACCRVALIDKGARIGEEIWGMCGVAVTLSQDFHVDHVTVSSGADGEWEEASAFDAVLTTGEGLPDVFSASHAIATFVAPPAPKRANRSAISRSPSSKGCPPGPRTISSVPRRRSSAPSRGTSRRGPSPPASPAVAASSASPSPMRRTTPCASETASTVSATSAASSGLS